MKSLLDTIAEHLTESTEVAKQTELPPVELRPVAPGLIDQKIELAHMYNEFRLAEQRVANGTLNEMEPGARYIRELNLRKIDIIREKFDSKFKDLLGIQDISEINDLDEAFAILEGNKPKNSKTNLPKSDDEFKDLWDQEYGTEYHGGKEQREKDVAAAKAAFLKRFPSKPLKKEEVEQIDEINVMNRTIQRGLPGKSSAEMGQKYRESMKKWNAENPPGKFDPKEHMKKVLANLANLKKEEVSYIEEKLTAADPANKWVSDFVHSENPKFAGKSKKERINMALGAYYAAKRGMKEEVESVDEAKKENKAKKNAYVADIIRKKLSPAVLPSLKFGRRELKKEEIEQVGEAAKTKFVHAKEVPDPKGLLDKPKAVKAYDKEGNLVGRYRSMNHAKQMKPGHTYKIEEEVEQVEEKYMGFKKLKAAIAAKGGARDPAAVAAAIGRKKYGKEKFQAMAAAGKRAANEEVEQIDELKASTLGSYVSKASKDEASRREQGKQVQAKYKEAGLKNVGIPYDRKLHSKTASRAAGKAMAMKKLTGTAKVAANEEAEGKLAVTPKEKALAAHHGNPKRITYGDVIKARIKSAKK